MPTMTAEISAAPTADLHNRTYARHPKLRPVHNNLGSSFFMYRSLISSALKRETPKSSEEAIKLLGGLHGNMAQYWFESFNPEIAKGYRLGASHLSDEFIQAAAGKHTGEAAKQINRVSDKAFIQGYNAALNKGWDRALAWERISEAYGLDPAQMRRWVTGFPTDGYHPEAIPEKSSREITKSLFERSERIAGHELWSAFQMGKQQETTIKIQSGILPKNTQKTWNTAGDELVCPQCGPLDGVSIGVGEQFDGFYAPPLHVNCRCEIELYIPMEVITKARGQDEYDRDSSGKFSSSEQRGVSASKPKKKNSSSPFITESEESQWDSEPAEIVPFGMPSFEIPEKIDPKKEKKKSENLIDEMLKDPDSEEIPELAEDIKADAKAAKLNAAARIAAEKEAKKAELKQLAEEEHEFRQEVASRKKQASSSRAESEVESDHVEYQEDEDDLYSDPGNFFGLTAQSQIGSVVEVDDDSAIGVQARPGAKVSSDSVSPVTVRVLGIDPEFDADKDPLIPTGEYQIIDIKEEVSGEATPLYQGHSRHQARQEEMLTTYVVKPLFKPEPKKEIPAGESSGDYKPPPKSSKEPIPVPDGVRSSEGKRPAHGDPGKRTANWIGDTTANPDNFGSSAWSHKRQEDIPLFVKDPNSPVGRPRYNEASPRHYHEGNTASFVGYSGNKAPVKFNWDGSINPGIDITDGVNPARRSTLKAKKLARAAGNSNSRVDDQGKTRTVIKSLKERNRLHLLRLGKV